jgi:hypothetical protein
MVTRSEELDRVLAVRREELVPGLLLPLAPLWGCGPKLPTLATPSSSRGSCCTAATGSSIVCGAHSSSACLARALRLLCSALEHHAQLSEKAAEKQARREDVLLVPTWTDLQHDRHQL